ncbi:cell division protein FtsK [Pseudonocardia sp. RS010]|uniref:cell division protein FtsK n=1 Tax=Pseudonocardia sp. RS010 TaxID=3385979 RepID=UPI00399FB35A
MSTEQHEAAELVPVDPPEQPRTIYATALSTRDADRRPIVPAYLRNRDEARQLAGWLARYGLHSTGYHTTRLPKYAARLALRVPAGVLAVAVAIVWWLFDREAAPLRAGAVQRGDAAGYLSLSRQRNQRVKRRGAALAAGTVAATVAAVLLATLAPGWAQALVVAALVVVLGKLGTPADRRVTDVATVSASAPPRLTADVVTRALQSLGIAAMSAKGATIAYPSPITRDGPGWRADVDLPFGVTVADVAERRDRLASGLRRPLSSVWPEPSIEQHAGRLILWVGDQPLNAVKPKPWPLAKAGAVDLLGGTFPFGTDQRQRLVHIGLAETNALVGSLPGGGKTAAVRVLALAAALDPHAELRIHEHKGSGDLAALERVAHRYVSGVSDQHIAETLASMREVHAELARRAEVLGKLPKAVVPDNKVTPELARTNKALRPLVLIVDEAQEAFSHGEYGDEAGKLAEAIIKRGRALAVIAVFATQRPDSKSLPTGVSTNVGVRFCLRVMDQTANDMVLGTSSYKNGIRATTFTPRDKGIGYLVGVGDEPAVVRTFYVDTVEAEKVAERARTAREAAGTLSGHALGEESPRTAAASLLDDLAVVFATITVEKVWREDVVAALTERWPDRYGDLTPDGLTAALRPLGITTGQVWGRLPDGAGANRRGISRADVQAALDAHSRELAA